jgi:hypothetical protein
MYARVIWPPHRHCRSTYTLVGSPSQVNFTVGIADNRSLNFLKP